MKYLIAGGTGFLGNALASALRADRHDVTILTRRARDMPAWTGHRVQWDGQTQGEWATLVDEADVVVNLAGRSLSTWPWTRRTKREFLVSRVGPGKALSRAIERAARKPRLLVQASGINFYGLRGEAADEKTPPGDDFLSQLAVEWEAATRPVEQFGVRRIIVRSSVVLGDGGLLPLMALPVKLYAGGRIGSGAQAMPWIHIADWIEAIRFLVGQPGATGPFNLVSPECTSNAQFTRQLASSLHRPYWLPMPAAALRLALGELSVLVAEGRFARPARLLELGFEFKFGRLSHALANLYD